MADADRRHMAHALGLARRALGQTAPNPAVGCVIVNHGHVVGRGWTAAGGRPHAETRALEQAGAAAPGATAYVTLEPCAHVGKTPACAAALIEAGVSTCVVAARDPDPRVNGQGIAMLREAGIAVREGVLRDEAEALNRGFFTRVIEGRPMVTLKLATSLDGRIAARTGDSRWITGEAARARGHLLRAEHDAIMVGSQTAILDDPELTCRIPGLEDRSPVRVIVDGRLRLPLTGKLVQTAARVPTLLFTRADADHLRAAAFEQAGVDLIRLSDGPDGMIDLAEALQALGRRGLTRVLVEGGSRLAAALLAAGLVDEVAWFTAPALLGGDAIPALEGLGLDRVADAVRLAQTGLERLGEDVLATYVRTR